MMSWAEAIAKVSALINNVASLVFGEQTLEERRMEKEAERVHGELKQALRDRRVGRANALYAELVQLRDKAAAKRAGQASVSRR